MTQIVETSPPATTMKLFLEGSAFDICYTITVGWFLIGSILDSWAHNTIPNLETFFTPWHAVLYAGVFSTFLLICVVGVINKRRGASWSEVLPPGYELAMWGALIFPVIGIGDGLWHIFFGIEKNVDAAFSPTHLGGIIASWLLVTAPYLTITQRHLSPSTWGEKCRLFVAFSMPLIFLANVTQAFHYDLYHYPLTAPTGQNAFQLLATSTFFLQAFILTAWSLYVVRAIQRLHFGLYTVALTLCGIVLAVMHGANPPLLVIGGAAGSGLLIDALAWGLQPTRERIFAFREFAIIVAVIPPAMYLLLLWLTNGLTLAWSIHLAFGSIIVTGVVGLLISYLMVPARIPHI